MNSVSDSDIIKVHLVDGSSNNVRVNDASTVEKIISVIVSRFSDSKLNTIHYALRLISSFSEHDKIHARKDVYWLQKNLSMKEVRQKYAFIMKQSDKLRYELRVRYLSRNLEDLFHDQKPTFYYFYDQVKSDYLNQIAPTLKSETVLELGSLEIRRFLKDMAPTAFDKKSNYEFLEKDIGLDKFFPKSLLTAHKPKSLRKSIQSYFKKFSSLNDADCIFRFLSILSNVARYDIEIFKCFLGSGWLVPVDIVIGPDFGISYVRDAKCSPISLAQFVQIQDIQTQISNSDSSKACVIFKASTTSEPLIISCSTLHIAESLADLVDGYHSLFSQNSKSIWTRRDSKIGDLSSFCLNSIATTSNCSMNENKISDVRVERRISSCIANDDTYEADYSCPFGIIVFILCMNQLSTLQIDVYKLLTDKEYELDRNRVMIEDILGEGQFGDVYRGKYRSKDNSILSVAIKACKLESEESHGSKFLEEAHIMQQFDHPHIVKLIGLCSKSPIWLVMELAMLGDLRTYLLDNKLKLNILTLISFCCQLSTALSYLESKKFVHRDVAARNVLVFGAEQVKLSDFGLSRFIEEYSFYTASKGKLPIKWMAPESINFRRFTLSSDVWMFGVAMWEIMSKGTKPFQGVRNQDVISKIENGERLPLPDECPFVLYNLMCRLWNYEPTSRPKMSSVKEELNDIYVRLKNFDQIPSIAQRAAAVRDRLSQWKRNPVERQFSLEVRARSNSPKNKPKGSKARFDSLDRNAPFSELNKDSDDRPRLLRDEFDRALMDKKLKTQQQQSEEDSKWLQSAEVQMERSSRCLSNDVYCNYKDKSTTKDIGMIVNNETLREKDPVYLHVLSVVKAIDSMSKAVPTVQAVQYVDLVTDVGIALKGLLNVADNLLEHLPDFVHSEVRMAEKVLGSCMQKVASSMRLAITNSETTLYAEFRCCMLADAHVLAVECKNFLQAVDSARSQAAAGSSGVKNSNFVCLCNPESREISS